MLETLLAGLLMGVVGSFHCVGMCGPLALSLPLNNATKSTRLVAILTYNLGRAFTYFLLGLILGFAGSRMMLIGYQQWLSITMGILILVLLLGAKFLPPVKLFTPLQNRLKKTLAVFFIKAKSPTGAFAFGLLNGLLPCGLVYMAVASALIIGNYFQSGLFMAAFGLGTMPLMALFMLTGKFVSVSLRSKMRKVIPYFIGVVAVLMILRGLNLGIPYISPAFKIATNNLYCPTPH